MKWAFPNHIRLLRYAGLFTYLCVGVPLLQMDWVSQRLAEFDQPRTLALLMWAGCYVVFGAVYWWLSGSLDSRRFRAFRLVGLVVMTATAMGVGYYSQSGLCALLLVVSAVVLPWLLPLPWAVVGLVAQNLLLVPVFATFPTLDTLALAIFQALVYLGFSVLTFVTAVIAKQQAEAREEQRKLNAELRATRALLAESSRIAERMRIARDLHDLMGHHLTALSLNLEVASHLVDARAAAHVAVAQGTAKRLLSDVREVVSELRQDDAVDLTVALRELAAGIPGLDVRLDLPARFTLDDPRRAEVLLRCAQEIITNAVRHARAEHLWVRFERTPEGELRLEARDDGRGTDDMRPGNGLNGMRERLAEFGGRLKITTARERGFALDAWLPLDTSPT
jgi:signal transduction histidine kinase